MDNGVYGLDFNLFGCDNASEVRISDLFLICLLLVILR